MVLGCITVLGLRVWGLGIRAYPINPDLLEPQNSKPEAMVLQCIAFSHFISTQNLQFLLLADDPVTLGACARGPNIDVEALMGSSVGSRVRLKVLVFKAGMSANNVP